MTEKQIINSLIKKEKPIGKLNSKNIINGISKGRFGNIT